MYLHTYIYIYSHPLRPFRLPDAGTAEDHPRELRGFHPRRRRRRLQVARTPIRRRIPQLHRSHHLSRCVALTPQEYTFFYKIPVYAITRLVFRPKFKNILGSCSGSFWEKKPWYIEFLLFFSLNCTRIKIFQKNSRYIIH